MTTRRNFIRQSAVFAAGSIALPSFAFNNKPTIAAGVQLYSFRDTMQQDAIGSLKKIAALGIKYVESAASGKGYYYGLKPAEMKKVCEDVGMKIKSGHVGLNDKWQQTMEDAAATGQEFLICSSLPMNGQTVDNYKKVSEAFNKAGEACKKYNLRFGYHNHDFEFEKDNGKLLYDVLLEETDPSLVCMELDLGWVVASGHKPQDYFTKHAKRFPLWHLKDMDLEKKHSTEFGKGGLDIQGMFNDSALSGLKYYFIEQEEYSADPWDSMKQNMQYLQKIKG